MTLSAVLVEDYPPGRFPFTVLMVQKLYSYHMHRYNVEGGTIHIWWDSLACSAEIQFIKGLKFWQCATLIRLFQRRRDAFRCPWLAQTQESFFVYKSLTFL